MRNQKAHTRAKRSSLRLFSFVRGASGIRQRVWVNIQASYPEGKDDHPKGNNIVQNTSMQALDQARSACMQGRSPWLFAEGCASSMRLLAAHRKPWSPKGDNQALCACMQGLLKSKILNALDCNPSHAWIRIKKTYIESHLSFFFWFVFVVKFETQLTLKLSCFVTFLVLF